ncbi:hypothetical protein [Providencia stuartii]|uniref:hypothetical protein n=1 Tax=Providencia stuartii TaxID=588 RepID=UPI0013D3A0E6|nr:hypothetical protein [Providencia stuartii]
MFPRNIDKMLPIGLSLLGIISIDLKISSVFSDRECVSFLNEPKNPITVYEYPNSPSFTSYPKPVSLKYFWVAKRTADNTWVQLYQAATPYGNLVESDKIGWIKAEQIEWQEQFHCFPKGIG